MPKSQNAQKLTMTAVERLTPGERDVVLWDSDVPGFHVRCTPGGAKTFALSFRVRGVARKSKIGSFPAMTVEQARKMARRWYADAQDGIDPATKRKADDMTVADAWARFDANHIARKKPKTQEQYRDLWRVHIEPVIGRKPLSALTSEAAEDIAARAMKRAAQVQADRLARAQAKRVAAGLPVEAPQKATEPGAATANRVLAVLSKFHAYCAVHKWRPKGDNPSQGLTRHSEVSRLPRVTDEQVRALGRAFEKARVRTTPWALGAIRALFFSGHRKQEVFALRWDQLHLDVAAPYADLADSKTGPRTLPLNEPMVAIIRELEALRPGFPSPFVFQGTDPAKPVSDPRKTWEFLKREAGLPWLRMHDFRHVFGTSAVSNGAALQLVQSIMGHADPRTTQRYARVLIEPAVAASNDTGGRLAQHTEKGAQEVRIVH